MWQDLVDNFYISILGLFMTENSPGNYFAKTQENCTDRLVSQFCSKFDLERRSDRTQLACRSWKSLATWKINDLLHHHLVTRCLEDLMELNVTLRESKIYWKIFLLSTYILHGDVYILQRKNSFTLCIKRLNALLMEKIKRCKNKTVQLTRPS